MNYLDLILLIPVGYAAYKGFKHGLIIELFTFLALFVGLYAGIHFSDFVAIKLKSSLGWSSKYMPVIAFTLIFLALGAMVYFAGKAIEKVIKVVHLNPLNKLAGVLFGSLKMLYIVSVVLVLLEGYDTKGNFIPKELKFKSAMYYPIQKVSTYSVPGMGSSLLVLQQALHTEQDSVATSVDQAMRVKALADSLGVEPEEALKLVQDDKN